MRPCIIPLAVALAAGCSGSDSRPGSESGGTPAGICAPCEIRLVHELDVGVGADDYGGVTRTGLVRDGRGQYYHANSYQPATMLVFDSTGSFTSAFGRYGEGPGEFQRIGRYTIGPGDTLHVFDNTLRRYSVFDPEHTFVRSVTIGSSVSNIAPLSGGRAVISARMSEIGADGLRFHLVEGMSIRSHFATIDSTLERDGRRPLAYSSLVVAESDSTVWTADRDKYRLERWNVSGVRLAEFSRDVEWFDRTAIPARQNQIKPICQDLRIDAAGLLWLLCSPLDPRAEDRIEIGPEAALGVYEIRSSTGDLRDLWDSVIEVIDPRSSRVLASLRSDSFIYGFADAERVYTFEEDDLGVGIWRVWRIQLVSAAS